MSWRNLNGNHMPKKLNQKEDQKTSAVYIELFHGRKYPSNDLNEWGGQGPVLGPLRHFHVTYGMHRIITEEEDWIGDLFFEPDGCVYYDGMWYGDYSIISAETVASSEQLEDRVEKPEKEKLTPPNMASMANKSYATLFKDRGFYPVDAFSKVDPRGPEYGRHEVVVGDDQIIKVTHRGGNKCVVGDYTMVFTTVEDFENWAINNA